MGVVKDREDAVSSVIGTVLMLGITVSVFAGVAIVILDDFQEADDAPRSELGVVRGDAAYLLRHQGGDPVPLQRGALFVGVGVLRHEVPLTDLADQTGDGASWRLGESLCVSCVFPDQNVTGVFLVVDDAIVLSEGTVPDQGTTEGDELDVARPAASPAAPSTGDVVTFSALVTNAGDASVGPVDLQVLVDGTAVGTDSVATLPSGFSTTLRVDWTATDGTHTVTFRVDPDDQVSEVDEGDNEEALTLAVTASTPDPGFAFLDPDRDGRYTEGIDAAIPDTEVLDGTYDAGADGLVLPPSLGPVTADSIAYTGARLDVHTDLTAQTGALELTSVGSVTIGSTLTTQSSGRAITIQAAGDLSAAGATVSSAGDLTLDGATLDLDSATLAATTSNRIVTLTGDAIDLDDADVDALGPFVVTAGTPSGTITAQRIDLDLLDAGADVTWRGDAIDLTDAVALLHGHVTLDAATTLTLDGAGFTMQQSNKALFADADGALSAVGASFILQGDAMLEGGSAVLDGLGLSNTGGSGTVTLQSTTGSLSLAGASVTANGHLTVSGATSTDAVGAALSTGGAARDLRVEALGGNVDVRSGTLTASGDLLLTVPSLAESVLVDGATLDDKNGRADVTPDGAEVGTPASGGIE